MKIFDKSIVDDIMLKQIFDESREKIDERGVIGDVLSVNLDAPLRFTE